MPEMMQMPNNNVKAIRRPRYHFINQQILQVYQSLPKIAFPLEREDIMRLIPNCAYMSYQTIGNKQHLCPQEVILAAGSRDGCTHYDVNLKRYLMLCNEWIDENNTIGRRRWTWAHEVGHILCGHHELVAQNQLSKENDAKLMEHEANCFAGNLLAPLPIMDLLNIRYAESIQHTFGLSASAAKNRFKQFQNWKNYHVKTAFENDLKNLYKAKS